MASNLLSIEQLSAGYGKLTILHQLDLVVMSGQFVAILGPNGSGKSTLLKTIFGLTDRVEGTISFAGQALNSLSTESLRALGIAYVPQRQNIFATLNVRENLQLAVRTLASADAKRALDSVYDLFPILRDRQPQRAGKLSGGERQMLAIAIAWLVQPTLMLLDEPSAGLSPLFVTEVFKTLQLLNQQGATLVVVEQNARSVLKFCDYAYLLREGQVVFQGTAEAMLADEEIVKGYLGMGRVT